MSQSHDTISLEEIVIRSDLIVAVSKAEPYTSVKKKRTSLLPWKPSFEVFYNHYQLERVIYQSERAPPLKDQTKHLMVRMADYSGRLHVHKLYYNKGIDKMPIYLRYKSEINASEIDHFIIFCQYDKEGNVFEYTVDDAHESMEKIELIESILVGQSLK